MERARDYSVCDGVQDCKSRANAQLSSSGRLPSTSGRNDDVHSGSGSSGNQLNGHLIVALGFEVEAFHADAILHHFTVDALQANGRPLALECAVATEDQSPDIKAIYWITDNEDGDAEYHNIEFNRFKEQEPYVYRMVKAHVRESEMVCELIAEAYERWPDLAWQFDPDNVDFDPVREYGTYRGTP